MSSEVKESTNEVGNKSTKNKKKGNIFSRNWSWIISMVITTVFMIVMMVEQEVAPFGDKAFTLVDSIHQYVPFFSDYQDKLKNGGSLFYTWDVGGGMNFQTLLLYYMASPLNLIIVFFSRKGLLAAMSSLISLKMAISSGACSFFLSRRRKKPVNNMLIVALGVAYGLNNYMCGYYWNIMWLDCIMILPIIILGFERLMKKSDPRIYTLALFYSFFCNYYISFIICIFLVLWFLCTGHTNVKKFFTDGLKFAGSSLLAAGMAAMSLLMAYLAIMKTASAGSQMPDWNWYQSFLKLLRTSFFLNRPINMDPFDGTANLYCGTLCIITLFLYITSNKIKLWDKVGKVVLVVIFIISMNQEKLNYIWHGFHDQYGIPNRFSFLYIFTLIVMCYEVMIKARKTHVISIIASIVLSVTVLVLCFWYEGFNGYIDDRYTLGFSMLLTFIYFVFLLLRREKNSPIKLNTIFISVVLLMELLVNASVGILGKSPAYGDYYLQYADVMEKAVNDIAEQEDRKFYRQEVIDPIMLDENTFNNMKSVGTFCSTVRGDMVNVMSYLGFYTGANEFIFNGSTPVTNDLLGIRYIYIRGGSYYPEAENMKPCLTSENLEVYENETALPIAYGVKSGLADRWVYANYNAARVLDDFALYGAGVKDEIFDTVHPNFVVTGAGCNASYDSSSPNLISYTGGKGNGIDVEMSFVVDKPGRYFINNRANFAENVTYTLNGTEKTTGRYQSQLMDLGELKEDDVVSVKIHFGSSYSTEGTISTYVSTLNKNALTEFRANLMLNAMSVKEFEDGYLKGDINLGDDQIIFTSIPYDEGWKVKLDGKVVKPIKIGNAFIGIEAGEGLHTVEMKYTPPGMIPGGVVSVICWIIYIIIFAQNSIDLGNKKKYNET